MKKRQRVLVTADCAAKGCIGVARKEIAKGVFLVDVPDRKDTFVLDRAGFSTGRKAIRDQAIKNAYSFMLR